MPETYCITCNNFREYTTKEEPVTDCVHGISFTYNRIYAYCNKCKSEVYAREVNEENIDRAVNAFYDAKAKIVD